MGAKVDHTVIAWSIYILFFRSTGPFTFKKDIILIKGKEFAEAYIKSIKSHPNNPLISTTFKYHKNWKRLDIIKSSSLASIPRNESTLAYPARSQEYIKNIFLLHT